MDKDSVERLRYDRRLQRRRGWLADGEYEGHVDALPDSTDKMKVGLDEDEGDQSAPAEASPPAFGTPAGSSAPAPTAGFGSPDPVPPPAQPVPIAGHFPDEGNSNS